MGAIPRTRKSFSVTERTRRETVLKEVMKANRPKLTSVIRSLVEDQIEAEDVLQDVYEELITAYDLGNTIEKASSWLVTVARNKIFDRFRRKRTRHDNREALAQSDGPQDPSRDNPDGEWARSWLRREIASALELLPFEQRRVFVMHELEGKSFKEISAETKAPLGTLLARKKKATDFLRNYLKEVYDELESGDK